MTLLSKFKSRKGIHIVEWGVLFLAITLGVGLMIKLTKAYENARWKGYDDAIEDSFYDRLPKGQWTDEDSGGCKCTDWVLLNACGVGDCGPCQKTAFRGCSLGCDASTVDHMCFTPGQPVPDCPECEQAATCLNVNHNIECWSDEPSQDLIHIIGNGPTPCGWGQMIVQETDCAACGNNPNDCAETIGCVPNGACEFQCTDINEALIGTWYIPCDPDNVPPTVPPNNNPPQNDHTHATFVDDGECGDDPCEFQCGGDLIPNVDSGGQGSSYYNGVLAPLGVCECPNNGGNPTPWTLEIVNGVPKCKCKIPSGTCTTTQCSDVPLSACAGFHSCGCNVSTGPDGDHCSGSTINCTGDSPETCTGGPFTGINCCSWQAGPTVDDPTGSHCNQDLTINDPNEGFCCSLTATGCDAAQNNESACNSILGCSWAVPGLQCAHCCVPDYDEPLPSTCDAPPSASGSCETGCSLYQCTEIPNPGDNPSYELCPTYNGGDFQTCKNTPGCMPVINVAWVNSTNCVMLSPSEVDDFTCVSKCPGCLTSGGQCLVFPANFGGACNGPEDVGMGTTCQ